MKQIVIFLLLLINSSAFAQELKPGATEALLEVIYKDPDTEHPIPNTTIILEDVKTKERKTFKTNDKGSFKTILPQGGKYKILVRTEKRLTEFDNLLDIPKAEGPFTYTYTIFRPIFFKTYILDIQFETGKSILFPGSSLYLDQFYDTLQVNSGMVVEIGGHTDNVGDNHSNQKLSEARANVVRTYLIEKGIAHGRITAVGYGEMLPVTSNDTPEGRQRNRRTEVKILSE